MTGGTPRLRFLSSRDLKVALGGVNADPAALAKVLRVARERAAYAKATYPKDPDQPPRFAAFSYLHDLAVLIGDGEPAVEAAERFLKLNEARRPEMLTREVLSHFAGRILDAKPGWEALAIAFLDPIAAERDRLRENLGLSPDDRWRRHESLVREARRVLRGAPPT